MNSISAPASPIRITAATAAEGPSAGGATPGTSARVISSGENKSSTMNDSTQASRVKV